MARYEMHVYCRRNGVSQDGGLHAERNCRDDKAAITAFIKERNALLRSYDEVHATIRREDGSSFKLEGSSTRPPAAFITKRGAVHPSRAGW